MSDIQICSHCGSTLKGDQPLEASISHEAEVDRIKRSLPAVSGPLAAVVELLFSQVDVSTSAPCLISTATRSRPDSSVRIHGREFKVHRIAYALWCGALTAADNVYQSCGNRHCFNPAHLQKNCFPASLKKNPVSVAGFDELVKLTRPRTYSRRTRVKRGSVVKV